MLEQIMNHYPEEDFLIADGFDEAVIGLDESSFRLIYSIKKCLEILSKDMDAAEAEEHFYYNVEGAYMGEKTPIWCADDY